MGNGVFHFYSYRDPNQLRTLEEYAKAIQEMASGNFT